MHVAQVKYESLSPWESIWNFEGNGFVYVHKCLPCVGMNVEGQHLLSSSVVPHIIFGDGSTH